MLTIETQVILNTMERGEMRTLLERHHYHVYDFQEDEEIRTQLRVYLETGAIKIGELSP